MTRLMDRPSSQAIAQARERFARRHRRRRALLGLFTTVVICAALVFAAAGDDPLDTHQARGDPLERRAEALELDQHRHRLTGVNPPRHGHRHLGGAPGRDGVA